jgi:hypothetical protein
VTLSRTILSVILLIYVIQAFFLPWKDIAVLLGGLFMITVVLVIKSNEIAKISLFLFGIFYIIDLLISGVSRWTLIFCTIGLILSYELIEYSLHHDVQVEDDLLHSVLMTSHAWFLVKMTGSMIIFSWIALLIFERISVQVSENIYVNIVVFCALFLGILYLLKDTSQ